MWGGVPEFLRTLPGIRYAITTNGAIVEDVAEHKILDERKLGCAQAIDILEMAGKFHTMYDAYVNGCAYGEKRFLEHMDDYAIPDTIQAMVRQTRQEVPDVVEKVRALGLTVEKINYFFGDQQERWKHFSFHYFIIKRLSFSSGANPLINFSFLNKRIP